jgi:hypothetical protein
LPGTQRRCPSDCHSGKRPSQRDGKMLQHPVATCRAFAATGMTLLTCACDRPRARDFSLSAARTNVRGCDRRVTAFCGASPLLQHHDWIRRILFPQTCGA